MATVNFLYRSTRDRCNLTLRLLFRHNKFDFTIDAKTKIDVSKDFFYKGRKQSTKDSALKKSQNEFERILNEIEHYVINLYNVSNPTFIDKRWLQDTIDKYYNPQVKNELPTTLVKYFDYYIVVRKNEVREATFKKCNSIKQLLLRYESEKNIILKIKDINSDFKINFEEYCYENYYASNTIARVLRFVKTVCYHAKGNGIETSFQLDSIKANYTKVGSIYLTFDELNKIENTEYNESYANARDWLLISCHCGQRISDFMRFKKDMITIYRNKKNEEKPCIEFKQVKTNKMMVIPLFPKVIEILQKRNGEFPKQISDQKYNEYVKEVCKIAGIKDKVKGSKRAEIEENRGCYRKVEREYEKWELVTSHIGRRSFATNYYGGNIPTALLINVTGHSSESMFLNYIGKSSKDKAIELTEYL
ncbi:tyrosine-type recombinase/integrase [Flavobacterium sp. FlaQc-28]|uniref:site-specific integrase n=1 Tax=Flavobacterium sp. FlaQc-28 TaxID=3374178 RepID=UPI0037570CC6